MSEFEEFLEAEGLSGKSNEVIVKKLFDKYLMLENRYKNILELSKDNADSFEYCLREVEEENDIYRKALEEIKNNCVEILATITEEGKPNGSIVDTVWCKNIPCCTLFELVENMQIKINEVLKGEE